MEIASGGGVFFHRSGRVLSSEPGDVLGDDGCVVGTLVPAILEGYDNARAVAREHQHRLWDEMRSIRSIAV